MISDSSTKASSACSAASASSILRKFRIDFTNRPTSMVLVNPSVDGWAVMVATLILIIIGVIAGAIPAYRAMRIKPIEAMNADK